MLGIDGSDDLHKYAMVSFWAEVAHCCTRELIVASERILTNTFVTLGNHGVLETIALA